MSESDYIPIACGLHELYEYAVMRRIPLDLVWLEPDGGHRRARLLPLDVYARDGAEYLVGETREGESQCIRLDRIRQARWSHSGSPLGD